MSVLDQLAQDETWTDGAGIVQRLEDSKPPEVWLDERPLVQRLRDLAAADLERTVS